MKLNGFANAGGLPRPGQWCRVRMADAAALAVLKAYGAHTVTHDGAEWAVGIFAAATRTPVATITRKDGTKETSGGDLLPARVVLQKANGTDVAKAWFDPKDNANKLIPVWFALDDKDAADCEPLTSKDHFPPGYVARTFAGEYADRFRDPSA